MIEFNKMKEIPEIQRILGKYNGEKIYGLFHTRLHWDEPLYDSEDAWEAMRLLNADNGGPGWARDISVICCKNGDCYIGIKSFNIMDQLMARYNPLQSNCKPYNRRWGYIMSIVEALKSADGSKQKFGYFQIEPEESKSKTGAKIKEKLMKLGFYAKLPKKELPYVLPSK